MFADIVFPKTNESEFTAMAKKLGYSKLCFVYDDLDIIKKLISKKEKTKTKEKPEILYGALTDFKNIQKAKQIANLVLIESSENDRKILENADEIILFSLEQTRKKDFMHQRASGLNHIMCSLAKRNDISIAFNFNLILNSEKKQRAELIGRISQNIRLCRKYKVQTIIASFAKTPYEMRSPHDLISFFANIGMHPKEAKDSLVC